MAAEYGIGLGALGLLVGFPLLLLGVLGVLGWLESWMLQPYERAVQINELLDRIEEADELELAVTRLVAHVADPPRAAPQGGVVRAALERTRTRVAQRRVSGGAPAPSASKALR